MEVIVIESAAFYKLIEEVIRKMQTCQLGQSLKGSTMEREWLTQDEAMILLPYRSKTSWQRLRDGGKINFFQYGRKILYKRESILEFIRANEILHSF